jgi:hypothetical protein
MLGRTIGLTMPWWCCIHKQHFKRIPCTYCAPHGKILPDAFRKSFHKSNYLRTHGQRLAHWTAFLPSTGSGEVGGTGNVITAVTSGISFGDAGGRRTR